MRQVEHAERLSDRDTHASREVCDTIRAHGNNIKRGAESIENHADRHGLLGFQSDTQCREAGPLHIACA